MLSDKRQDNKGVTFVEVMIALVVLLIVFMGLIQASLLGIDHNLRNELRDEAVRIASDEMVRIKALPFASIETASATRHTRNIRNISNFPFTVTTTVENLDASGDNKQITVNIQYTYRDNASSYNIISTVRNR